MIAQTIIFAWRSVYEFKPVVVQNIVNEFNSKSDYETSMKCIYNPAKHTFNLEGDKRIAEAASQVLMDIIEKKVLKEFLENRRHHAAGNEYIKRAKSTMLNIQSIPWLEDPDNVVTKDDDTPIIKEYIKLSKDQETIAKCEVTQTWTPKNKGSFAECFYKDGIDYTQEIARLCDCIILCDWIDKGAKIGAPSQASMSKAINKFKRMEHLFMNRFMPLKAHLINSEGIPRFELRVIPLNKQMSTAYKTTLVPTNSTHSVTFETLASTRLMKYDPGDDKYKNVVIDIREVYTAREATESAVWGDYTFPAHEPVEQEDDAMDKRKAMNMGDVPPGLKKDEPSFTSERGSGATSKLESSQNISLQPKPLNTNIQADPTTGLLDFGARPMVNLEDRVGEVEQEAQIESAAPKRKARAVKVKDTNTDRTSALHTSVRYTEISPRSTSSGEGGGVSLMDTYKHRDMETIVLAHESVRVKPHDSIEQQVAAPTINDQGELLLGSRPPSAVNEPSNVAQTTTRKPKIKRSKRSDTGQSSSTGDNDATKELASRTYRTTMSQKAPAIRRERHEDDITVLENYQKTILKKVFTTAFEEIRTRKGFMQFKLQFGRILLDQVPKKILKTPLHWKEWDGELKSNGVDVVFTEILTSYFYDAEFLMDLRLSKAEFIFSRPDKKTISYEVECELTNGTKFFIIVDAETFLYIVRTKAEEIATVYWNCPTRSWDARFLLEGGKILRDHDVGVEKLIHSFQISANREYADITYDVDGSNFTVNKVVVRRETQHDLLPVSLHNGEHLVLAITEHQDLYTQHNLERRHKYRAFGQARELMEKDNRIWYSFAIIPTKVDSALGQNLELELGEEVAWTVEDILQFHQTTNPINAMMSTANYLIKKMDDLGFNNSQVTTLREDRSSDQRQQTFVGAETVNLRL